MKKIIVFDLDGTLAKSKQAIDAVMAGLLKNLLDHFPVCVISGGDWPQFESQLLSHLPGNARLDELWLMPTSGTKLYRHTKGWAQIYAESLTDEERHRILAALNLAVADAGFGTERSWGERVQDRGTQITFSALGQQAPPAAKSAWDPDQRKRTRLKAFLDKDLGDFAVRLGGSTSVDITRPGIDKAYGVRRLAKATGFTLDDMLFVGDALYPGGNDAPVRDAGVATIAVRDIEDTKRAIDTMIKLV